jgi:hypothetical protein
MKNLSRTRSQVLSYMPGEREDCLVSAAQAFIALYQKGVALGEEMIATVLEIMDIFKGSSLASQDDCVYEMNLTENSTDPSCSKGDANSSYISRNRGVSCVTVDADEEISVKSTAVKKRRKERKAISKENLTDFDFNL